MCRVLLMNKQGEKEIEKTYGLDKYLKYLEKQMGGHGNGFALMKNGKIIKLEKGVNLDVRDIANVFRKTNYDWAIFHTRLASIGTISDSNCHPFRRGETVIAMNGTESTVNFLANIKGITDTEAILETMEKYHLSLAALKKFSSIFVGFYNHKPFVVADNTLRIKILKKKNSSAVVFASSFPKKFKNIYEPKNCFTWNGGNLNIELEKHKKRYFPVQFDNYIYQEDLYGQCYLEALEKEGGNVA